MKKRKIKEKRIHTKLKYFCIGFNSTNKLREIEKFNNKHTTYESNNNTIDSGERKKNETWEDCRRKKGKINVRLYKCV